MGCVGGFRFEGELLLFKARVLGSSTPSYPNCLGARIPWTLTSSDPYFLGHGLPPRNQSGIVALGWAVECHAAPCTILVGGVCGRASHRCSYRRFEGRDSGFGIWGLLLHSGRGSCAGSTTPFAPCWSLDDCVSSSRQIFCRCLSLARWGRDASHCW